GIGLAAIQVGTPKRIITMDLAKKEEPKNPQVFINPEILWTSEEKATYEEGCLSIPEYYSDVERPAQVRGKYLDREGKPREIEANGLFATCLQHEIDHLNGILFIDHLSKLKRDRVLKKFTKPARRAAEKFRVPDFRDGCAWHRKSRIRDGFVKCRCASCSWVRRTSPCRRSSRSSAAVTRSWPSIRVRPSRPAGAASISRRVRSNTRRAVSPCRCSRPRRCARRTRRAARVPIARMWWSSSPMVVSGQRRSSKPVRWARSICAPRFCRAGGAPRRLIAGSWRGTRRPA